MEQLQINYNLIPTTNDNILAVIHWFDGKKFRVDCRISTNKGILMNYVNNKKKDIIIEILSSYINHRDYAIINQLVENNQQKINAIYRLKQMLQVYKKSNVFKLCQMVVCLEKDILLIMPGSTSKFHSYYSIIINQLLTYCKNLAHEQK